ncbi:MAG TPA: SulP family inorganic anion transporter [Rhizomicrobium sp.]|nr:SulP family inorganic anion transporter [Rhizomicrobium sp.]
MPLRSVAGRRNIAAALALAAIAIPEQIATSRLAGAPPATGLLVFMAGSLGFFLLGYNRYISVGADSTIAPIFAAALAGMATSTTPQYMALASLLAVMAGVLITASGLLKMGWVARLLSVPVITGFLAGISVHIALSQLPALLGVPSGGPELGGLVRGLIANIAYVNPVTVMIGLAVFAATFVSEKWDCRFPAPLIALIICALLVRQLHLAAHGVKVLGAIQRSPFRLPHIGGSDVMALLPISLLVALVVVIQTATVSRAMQEAGETGNLDRDLMGVGVGNILSGMMGGFAANSSPPRTAIVRETNAASRMAGLLAALLIAALYLFGLDYLADIPVAALAGLLLFVAQRIFHLDVMRAIAARSRPEFALLAATAIAIVLTPVQIGVAIGVVLSLMYGVWTITQTRVLEFAQMPGSTIWWPIGPGFAGQKQPGIMVAGFQAPLFFLNADSFQKSLSQTAARAQEPLQAIILEASSMVELDYSAAQMLEHIISEWKAKGVIFLVARLESVRAQRAFETFGILPLLGGKQTFHSVDEAVRFIRSGIAAS